MSDRRREERHWRRAVNSGGSRIRRWVPSKLNFTTKIYSYSVLIANVASELVLILVRKNKIYILKEVLWHPYRYARGQRQDPKVEDKDIGYTICAAR
jgi:hypothetical protein